MNTFISSLNSTIKDFGMLSLEKDGQEIFISARPNRAEYIETNYSDWNVKYNATY
jgi:hypothetical protein